jgi:hypothetical protein
MLAPEVFPLVCNHRPLPPPVRSITRVGGIFRVAVDRTSACLHGGGDAIQAARIALESMDQKAPIDRADQAQKTLQSLLHWCLIEGYYADGAQLCWAPNLFTSEPECTRSVWTGLDESSGLIVMGGASMSKSYGCGVYFMLDWVVDPEYTTVKVLGPSEAHLQDNLFSHLIELHRRSAIELPGREGDLFIGLDFRQRRSSISGVVIPLGKKPAGRLQGAKRFPRKAPHPKFGELSRMRILLDEAENIPAGIWSDIDNVLSNSEGVMGLKIACAFNPKNPALPLGIRGEPQNGWASFNLDKDFNWISSRNWRVVRLDGERCENVVQNRIIFPGLQTAEGLRKLEESSGGKKSASYMSFGRGAYPSEGIAFSVIPMSVVNKLKGTFIWQGTPRPVGGADLALEGGDRAVLATGLWGPATAVSLPPSIENPKGVTITFKNAQGRPASRLALQGTGLLTLERGDTVSMARQLKRMGLELGIEPDWLCLDRTGHGAGVHDLLKEIWSDLVIGINYSEAATSLKIMEEDTQVAKDEYDRIYSEIWFAMKRWAEFDVFKLLPTVDLTKNDLTQQLAGRTFDPKLRKKLDTKREFKMLHGGLSPDDADALTLMVHAVRVSTGGFTPTGIPQRSVDENVTGDEVDTFILDATSEVDHID